MNSTIMFVSHKLSPSKKTFQKPNILRRNCKVLSTRAPCKPSLAPPAAVPLTNHQPLELAAKHVEEVDSPHSIQSLKLELAQDEAETPNTLSAAAESVPDAPDVKTDLQKSVLVDDAAAAAAPELVDVEAFLAGGRPAQYKAQYEVHTKLEDDTKWHIDFEDADDRNIKEPCAGRGRAARAGAALAVLECPEPSCGKAFATEQKLRRHRAAHGPRRAQPVECPARAAAGAGGGAGGAGGGGDTPGPPCARVFLARDLLAAHLRDDHQPDDAPHRCGECGRRFFWAVGLRAHSRAHLAGAGAGAPLACAWPGCARVFRQPCRLREHARAHTGDRPYRCTHPGCAWAFRTASKLLRHARKHTGERRHRCACGRAFRRREHLRHHQARHSTAGAAECGAAPAVAAADAEPGTAGEAAVASADDDTYTVRLAGAESSDEGGGGRGGGGGGGRGGGRGGGGGGGRGADGRAARTHCTWPLAHHAPDTLVEERSCAVRSDLFLAAAGGDDSQQLMAGAGAGREAAAGAGEEAGAALEAAGSPPPLGLLDLMQEELLYADAVDESSFQVLLLSEELA